MKIRTIIKKNTYQDSMKLMQLQKLLNNLPGVISTGVVMGTAVNKNQLKLAGLYSSTLEEAGPNDLCIAIKGESTNGISAALDEIEKVFHSRQNSLSYTNDIDVQPKTISSAVRSMPNANIAVISVPGRFASFEAMKALQAGLHVFLFSNNVSIEDEISLKAVAEQKGLLAMGPDCGTAIVSGIPLGFSNAIRRGRIGIVAASGTGLQEVCCIIHRMGEGISQAIGTGGRDLSREVGGKTFISATEELLKDDETEVVGLMAKNSDENVVRRLNAIMEKSEKPIITLFIGSTVSFYAKQRIYQAANLHHLAASCVKILRGENQPAPISIDDLKKRLRSVIDLEIARFHPSQKYLRALFTGGS
ncbi:MAG: hypothetical protein AB1427_09140, partial [Thermodesulfobacteriota bacterium]